MPLEWPAEIVRGILRQKYLTPDQVSERWNRTISARTLANWRYMGTGPKFTRVGGKILYPLEDLLEWESTRTVDSTSQYKR